MYRTGGGNLDTTARADVVSALVDFKRAGKTILFASHRPEEVETLADRVAIMQGGRLISECPAANLTETLNPRASLRLFVEDEALERAIQTLNTEGLSASRNGHGLIVQVGARRKAAPFDVLTRARISVQDFEILPDSNNGH